MVNQRSNAEPGTIKIRGAVLGSIARLAVLETKGVAGMRPGIFRRLRARVTGNELDEGVRVRFKENGVKIIVSVLMEYGTDIPQVAGMVQEKVKQAIEEMTGIASLDVVVDVRGVVRRREK